ncbi:hypothetical protein SAMN04488026_105921 [Aliiruegeria lutimaris]|uniref:Uncharacterized protein n=1 Tax=Aliiruegeria lutimaris TaxID=571298 RepID=A0A1G9FTY8_9RHOB|nr:hypothetical protein SAMN04488026_105921 [Aliiruegeria lutimaris]
MIARIATRPHLGPIAERLLRNLKWRFPSQIAVPRPFRRARKPASRIGGAVT